MKKILFIISSLSGKGGMERVATLLANFLLEEKYRVTIITRDSSVDQKLWFPINSDVEIVNFNTRLVPFLKLVQDYIKENRPGFVISHNMGKMSIALSLLSYKKYNCKLISLEHVSYVSSPIYVQCLKRVLYHKVDRVVVLSKDDEVNYGKFHKCVFKVNNPSPFEFNSIINYNNNSKKIISIGRLTYQKGFDLLLRAWSLIEKKYPDWTYDIYGDGEELNFLGDLRKKLKIERLVFKGFSDNLAEKYRESSFFVLSSRFEGFGMVLVEAHSFGLPTISFDCPSGPGDIIINDFNGILVQNGNVEQLAKAIELLINDEDLRMQCSTNAIESAKLYSKNNIINRWKEVLHV